MIAIGTRVQVPTGETGTVTAIDEMASGTSATVLFDERGVTANGSARYHLTDLLELSEEVLLSLVNRVRALIEENAAFAAQSRQAVKNEVNLPERAANIAAASVYDATARELRNLIR